MSEGSCSTTRRFLARPEVSRRNRYPLEMVARRRDGLCFTRFPRCHIRRFEPLAKPKPIDALVTVEEDRNLVKASLDLLSAFRGQDVSHAVNPDQVCEGISIVDAVTGPGPEWLIEQGVGDLIEAV